MRFEQKEKSDVRYLSVDSWSNTFHGFVGRDIDIITEPDNWRRVFAPCGAKLVLLTQVHGRDFIELDGNEILEIENEPEADAWILKNVSTVSESYALGIKSADCGCILIRDEKADIQAAIHSGWKSTKLNIMGAVLARMLESGSQPENIEIAVGPHARVNSYEIGLDVVQEFQGQIGPEVSKYLKGEVIHIRNNVSYLDISSLLEAQARQFLGDSSNILVSDICTIDCGEYFSFRREKQSAGRQLSFIGKLA